MISNRYGAKSYHLRLIHLLFCLLVVCHSYLKGQAPPSWHSFTTVDKRISVLLPQTPKFLSKEINSIWGPITHETHLFTESQEPLLGASFVINRIKYPIGHIDLDSIDLVSDLLVSTIESIQMSNGMGKVYENEQNEGRFPGRNFRLANNELGTTIKGRCFFGQSEIVVIMAYTSTSQSLMDQVDWFFKSFRYLTD